jgi:peptidoglycan/LPS O-acetylase OafA/YrhL
VRRLRWALIPAGILLTLPCYLLSNEHPFVLTLGLTLNYLGYGMVLAAVLTLTRLLPRPLGPALAYVGFYSYSIYLWHLPFLAVVRSGLAEGATAAAVFYAGSIVGGVVMARLVEIPALRLRERWVPAAP